MRVITIARIRPVEMPEAEIYYCDGTDLNQSAALARTSDAVIFVVGYDHDDEGEHISNCPADSNLGGDRKSLGLHANEIELLNAVGPLNRQSAAVLIGGNMILIEEWKHSVSSI